MMKLISKENPLVKLTKDNKIIEYVINNLKFKLFSGIYNISLF